MAQQSPALQYSLSIDSVSQHLFAVNVSIPAHNEQQLTVSLPTWIPGSYMVRDFSRNMVNFSAKDKTGAPIKVTLLDKQQWQLDTQGQAVEIHYQVYAFDLSVRSAYINDEYAFCNGTSVFVSVSGFESLPCEVFIDVPADRHGWQIKTTLPHVADNQFSSQDYAELIDHPIFMGVCTSADFDVDGVTFTLMFSGKTQYDMPRLCSDLEKVCAHHLNLFGKPYPVKHYLFMTLIADQGYGGLEHRSSTALLFPRFELPLQGEPDELNDSYVNFISLCSHELFHTWHVKRIKPDVMVKPDLSQETYTDQLWIYEGFTSFYDDVTLARVGVIPPERYFKIVAQNLTRLYRNAGRFKQSIAESSFYAWNKFYKQDAGSVNNIVSYYNKGGIVALGLDLLLRQRSGNTCNLDDLMRLLWAEFGDESGTPADVIDRLCRENLKVDVSDYLASVVYGTEDVNLTTLLESIGVSHSLQAPLSLQDKGGESLPSGKVAPRFDFGAVSKDLDTGLLIQSVQEGSAAAQAGLQIDDKLIAADGYVVNTKLLQRMLSVERSGTMLLTVIRDGRIMELAMPLVAAPPQSCVLQITDNNKAATWLGC
ncbi:M61 family metallopeptidase [Alteromonas lipolytica]|uniref:Protease n=1 Tax=Alteromonas lipolytica TaxID=1856405 RepID=A0A1E8FGQ3_9ALTE|nr:PDZ domain-containing protein [Alteromonas lipolytica]OFI35111.1 protease [Alteromonas lipolytica]GGF56777.1 peptidase M61 [Alteromonas lipolytica]